MRHALAVGVPDAYHSRARPRTKTSRYSRFLLRIHHYHIGRLDLCSAGLLSRSGQSSTAAIEAHTSEFK
jgi:hypothetical protein